MDTNFVDLTVCIPTPQPTVCTYHRSKCIACSLSRSFGGNMVGRICVCLPWGTSCQSANHCPSLVMTFHCETPGIHFSPGNSADTSASSRAPSLFSSRAAMTASSSTGFKEQVEYTILPPSASCSAPRVAIRSCRPWSCKLFKVVHFFQTSMFFLIVPSPLQGTSHKIRS